MHFSFRLKNIAKKNNRQNVFVYFELQVLQKKNMHREQHGRN